MYTITYENNAGEREYVMYGAGKPLFFDTAGEALSLVEDGLYVILPSVQVEAEVL